MIIILILIFPYLFIRFYPNTSEQKIIEGNRVGEVIGYYIGYRDGLDGTDNKNKEYAHNPFGDHEAIKQKYFNFSYPYGYMRGWEQYLKDTTGMN